MRKLGLGEWEVEYRFHPVRRFRWDYALPAHRLAIEIDGGIWKRGGGAHSHPVNIKRDVEKHNLAMLAGWRWLRIPPEHLKASLPLIEELVGQAPERANQPSDDV